MKTFQKINTFYTEAKQNVWLHYFYIFNRIVLAAGFIPAGITKVLGERFANGLSVVHPMGHYLEALSFTGYYYTFIGVAQIVAGILILIPRTVLLGALIYFPIILNICILSFAVRFDGSLLTAPLMVLANLYLLCWNYDRLRFVFPIKDKNLTLPKRIKPNNKKFPFLFFLAIFTTIVIVVSLVFAMNKFAIMPRNSLKDCQQQFIGTENENAGTAFCKCIHEEGSSLNKCLSDFDEKE